MADRMMFRTVVDGQSSVRAAKEYARDFPCDLISFAFVVLFIVLVSRVT